MPADKQNSLTASTPRLFPKIAPNIAPKSRFALTPISVAYDRLLSAMLGPAAPAHYPTAATWIHQCDAAPEPRLGRCCGV